MLSQDGLRRREQVDAVLRGSCRHGRPLGEVRAQALRPRSSLPCGVLEPERVLVLYS
jgi:hypothetical protein